MAAAFANIFREQEAKDLAGRIREEYAITSPIETGVILGTGFGDKLDFTGFDAMNLASDPSFNNLQHLEGHKRRLLFGNIGGKEIIALSGRIHLNEDPGNSDIYKMVRLQTEVMLQLGVKKLIVTCAAGSLPGRKNIQVGDLVVIDSFVTLFAPQMPLWAGEFCSPEDALSEHLIETACGLKNIYESHIHYAGYAMVLGPFFEGRKHDKRLLAESGAQLVGMSTLPEACVAALYPDVEMLGLAFVTNDAIAEHSHEQNLKTAESKSELLSRYLENLIQAI